MIGSTTAANTITGNSRDNTLVGGSVIDIISGGDGNNLLDGGEGNNNTLTAGNGNNTVTAGDGTNTITTGTGDDNISVGNGNNSINAGGGNNTINTGNGANTVQPNPGPGFNTVNGQVANHPPQQLGIAYNASTPGWMGNTQDGNVFVDLKNTGGSYTVTGTVTAFDPDATDSLTFSVAAGPGSITPTGGVLSYTVTSQDVGKAIKITVRVTDNGTPPMWADYDYFVVVRDSTNGQPADLDWVPVDRDGAFGTFDGGQLEQHLINAKVTDLGPGNEALGVSVVDYPTQYQQFDMNPPGANGWWTYTPKDFFAGDDPFTYKGNDGTKDGNVATIHQYSTYLGVHQVSFGENTSDLLTRDQRHGTGAYLPVDDDDDDYNSTPDKSDDRFAKDENDLLQIDLPAPVNVQAGWSYSLDIPTGFRVYRSKDAGVSKKDVEVTGGQKLIGFSGSLWVEATGSVSGNLKLTWTAKDGTTSTDYVVLHSFTMQGPHDVPGTSTYTYKATDGLPGDDSFWLGGGNGGNLSAQMRKIQSRTPTPPNLNGTRPHRRYGTLPGCSRLHLGYGRERRSSSTWSRCRTERNITI